MATYEPTRLERWTRPQNYIGAEWVGWYSAGVGQSRDSDTLERSNFRAVLAELGDESDTVQVVREGHWAVGWVEWIAIHADDAASLRRADELAESLEGYPVLDEDDSCSLQWEEAAEVWEHVYTWQDRIAHIRSKATRRGYFRTVLAAVRGDSAAAAEVDDCFIELADAC